MPKIHPAPEGLPPDDDDRGVRVAFEDTAERVSDTGSGDINGGSAVTSSGSGLEHKSAGDRNTTAAADTDGSLTVTNNANDTNGNSTAGVNNAVDNDVKTNDSPVEQTSDRTTAETSDARAKSVRDTLRTLAEPAVYIPPGTPLTSSLTSPSRRPTLERMNTQLQRNAATSNRVQAARIQDRYTVKACCRPCRRAIARGRSHDVADRTTANLFDRADVIDLSPVLRAGNDRRAVLDR